MRWRIVFWVALLLLFGLFLTWRLNAPSYIETFPSPPSLEIPGPDFSQEKFAIEGQVLGPKGEAPSDAWVSAVGSKRVRSMRCETGGRFRIEKLPEGDFEITAAAKGFRPASVSVKSGSGPLTIQLEPLRVFGAGPNPPPSPEAKEIYTARILRAANASAGYAAALLPVDPESAPNLFRAPVDGEGFFQFSDLLPGKYRLLILSEARPYDLDYRYRELEIEIGPGKKPPDSIEISTMEIRGIVLSPPLPDVFPAPDPLPLGGATVRIRLLNEEGRAADAGWMDTENDGRFLFVNLPEGKYELSVIASGFEKLQRPVEKAPGSSVVLETLLTRKRR